MAVVTTYSKAHRGYAVGFQPKPINGGTIVKALQAKIAIANGDSIASKVYFGSIPSNARILPQSILYHTGVTGVSDFDIGLERGSSADPDVLADGLNITSAGTKAPLAAVATADLDKLAWELLGLTNDPGGVIDVYGTLKAAATADGTLQLFLMFQTNG
jgi:hypothetical protein